MIGMFPSASDAPYFFCGFYSVHAGQIDVHQDESGPFRQRQPESFFAGFGRKHRIPGPLQRVGHDLQVVLVVLNNEHGAHAILRYPAIGTCRVNRLPAP